MVKTTLKSIQSVTALFLISISWPIMADVGTTVTGGVGTNSGFEDPIIGSGTGTGSSTSNSSTSSTVNAAGGSGYVGTMLGDVNTIEDHSAENSTRGRAEKTTDAIGQGNSGIGEAVASGVALTAAGVRLLPWPTTPQGIALITLGSIEFAQAGASTGVKNDNVDGKDTLTKGTQTGSQTSPEQFYDQVKKQINTPEMQQALAKNGINADDFADKVARGQLSNPDEVAKAANINESISPDVMNQAMADAQANFTKYTNGKEDVPRIGTDDSNPPGFNGNGGSFGSGKNSQDSVNPPVPANLDSNGSRGIASAEAGKAGMDSKAGQGSKDPLNGLNQLKADLLKKYFGKDAATKKALSELTELELAKYGIKVLHNKQNIFQVARRTYRAFRDWRSHEIRRTRIAQADVKVK